MKRVVITGVGALTPVGNSAEEFWSSIKAGKSGIGRITKIDTTDLKCKIAAELKGFDPESVVDKKQLRRTDSYAVYTIAAAGEAIENAGLDKTIGQYFAALTNMRSVGVMGDERTYDYAVALRAVNTIDFMTAEAAEIPYEVLNKVMSRVINEVRGVNRIFYDLTSKPPGTIEFE